MVTGFSFFISQYLDIDTLVQPRKDAAKQKLLEEVRAEAIETAIAKVTTAMQIRKEEEEHRKKTA